MTRLFRRALDPLVGMSTLAAAAIIATFFAIGIRHGNGPHPDRIWLLLLIDIAVLAALAALLVRRIYVWRSANARGLARSRLQQQVVRTFSLVTVLPTVAVAIFSILLFNLGIEAWFNTRVNTAVNESLAVAQAYLDEHRENIRMSALSMVAEIDRFADLAATNPVEFNRMVSAAANSRQLTEVVVFQGNRIIAQGRLSFSIAFESIPLNAIEQAANGKVVILQSNEGDEEKVRALAKIDALPDAYVLVGRLVDEKVIAHLQNTRGAVSAYRRLKDYLAQLQWAFSIVFIILALALLLAVVWYGLVFAGRLTRPIAALSAAADRVRAGDYTARAPADQGDDSEISALARVFNRMVEQLQSQRTELIAANRELDARRRFSEAVLAGVSAGVIALSSDKRIALSNRSAASILKEEGQDLSGRTVDEVLPGIHELLSEAEAGSGSSQGSVSLQKGASALTLHVRATAERDADGKTARTIVTFDDITPLVSAQRQAAWSDVARRVAHEIKNPLTPIALSAERLKRKYGARMQGEDAETFARYVDTIIRHVGDIGRMVEEFVAFARMPGAVMKPASLSDIVRRAVFSEQVAHPGITYTLRKEEGDMRFPADERQVAQALSNLLKNAAEAIEGMEPPRKGEINITLNRHDGMLQVEISDNGPGFPEDLRARMMEPYVTTRAKGTGLGLAIVKKIVEEHKGSILAENRTGGGARIVLSFPEMCDINAPT